MPWATLLLSVVLHVLLPLIAGALTCHRPEARANGKKIEVYVRSLKPWSVVELLATVVQPQTIVLIAVRY